MFYAVVDQRPAKRFRSSDPFDEGNPAVGMWISTFKVALDLPVAQMTKHSSTPHQSLEQ
jgi:hypothetical protein